MQDVGFMLLAFGGFPNDSDSSGRVEKNMKIRW